MIAGLFRGSGRLGKHGHSTTVSHLRIAEMLVSFWGYIMLYIYIHPLPSLTLGTIVVYSCFGWVWCPYAACITIYNVSHKHTGIISWYFLIFIVSWIPMDSPQRPPAFKSALASINSLMCKGERARNAGLSPAGFWLLESGILMDFGQHPCTKQRRKGVIWQDQQMNDEQYEHWVSQHRTGTKGGPGSQAYLGREAKGPNVFPPLFHPRAAHATTSKFRPS